MKNPMSMTAFGQGESTGAGVTWTAEVKSVNHRYCDVSIKMDRKYLALEERIKKEVLARYVRGRIDVVLNTAGFTQDAGGLQVNLELARQYRDALRQIQESLDLPAAPPDLSLLMTFREIITPGEKEEDLETVWAVLREALVAALERATAMRRAEGSALKQDLLERLENFSDTVEKIAAAAPELVRKKEELLKERLDNLLKGVDIDPARLAQEVAIMADKSDITEELVRLRSHIHQFTHFLDLNEPVGRRLDFLLQEFLREINTLASKIGDAAVAHLAVELKNEVEKMREQVQNIE